MSSVFGNVEIVTAQEVTEKEGVNVDLTESAVIQKDIDSSTLTLHNSFELLVEESELPSEEARLVDKDLALTSKDMLIDVSENVEEASKEKVGLTQSTNSEAPCENRSSQIEVLISSKPLIESDNGRQSFPI